VTADWVAGCVRARAMARRRLGREAARRLAANSSIESALAMLAATSYGHDVRPLQTLAEAQHAVVDTTVWNMRVLGGWMPREGVTMLRILLGTVEVANVDDLLMRLSGRPTPPAHALGRLGTAWSRLARSTSADQVRRVLAASPWGDPGGSAPRTIGLAMRASQADRTIAAVPHAARWAAGATALLIAREVVLEGRPLPQPIQLVVSRVVGPMAGTPSTLPDLASAHPAEARWVLTGISQPQDLWRAEVRWWAQVERDGYAMVRRSTPGPEVLVGTVALLAVDAWWVRAALETAARGGGSLEALDAVA
jgi:hypothetical protein